MLTLYINREVDGYLDLYVTNGTVYKTDGGIYGHNSKDGYKILVDTFRERRDDPRTAESRATQAVREWMAAYHTARIPVQNGSETAEAYVPIPGEERHMPARQHRSRQ